MAWEGGGLEFATCNGVPWGTASWVRWRPLPVRVRRWSRADSAVQPRGRHCPALPATAAPRAATQLQASAPPPPARAAAAAASSSAAAASPPAPAASLDSSGGGCQLGSFLFLLFAPSHRHLLASTLFCYLQSSLVPRASRCKGVSPGQRISGQRISSLRIVAAAAARRPREGAPCTLSSAAEAERGGPSLGGSRLDVFLHPPPPGLGTPSWSDEVEAEMPESLRLI